MEKAMTSEAGHDSKQFPNHNVHKYSKVNSETESNISPRSKTVDSSSSAETSKVFTTTTSTIASPTSSTPLKRKRGRPPKYQPLHDVNNNSSTLIENNVPSAPGIVEAVVQPPAPPKRKRGRPPKNSTLNSPTQQTPKSKNKDNDPNKLKKISKKEIEKLGPVPEGEPQERTTRRLKRLTNKTIGTPPPPNTTLKSNIIRPKNGFKEAKPKDKNKIERRGRPRKYPLPTPPQPPVVIEAEQPLLTTTGFSKVESSNSDLLNIPSEPSAQQENSANLTIEAPPASDAPDSANPRRSIRNVSKNKSNYLDMLDYKKTFSPLAEGDKRVDVGSSDLKTTNLSESENSNNTSENSKTIQKNEENDNDNDSDSSHSDSSSDSDDDEEEEEEDSEFTSGYSSSTSSFSSNSDAEDDGDKELPPIISEESSKSNKKHKSAPEMKRKRSERSNNENFDALHTPKAKKIRVDDNPTIIQPPPTPTITATPCETTELSLIEDNSNKIVNSGENLNYPSTNYDPAQIEGLAGTPPIKTRPHHLAVNDKYAPRTPYSEKWFMKDVYNDTIPLSLKTPVPLEDNANKKKNPIRSSLASTSSKTAKQSSSSQKSKSGGQMNKKRRISGNADDEDDNMNGYWDFPNESEAFYFQFPGKIPSWWELNSVLFPPASPFDPTLLENSGEGVSENFNQNLQFLKAYNPYTCNTVPKIDPEVFKEDFFRLSKIFQIDDQFLRMILTQLLVSLLQTNKNLFDLMILTEEERNDKECPPKNANEAEKNAPNTKITLCDNFLERRVKKLLENVKSLSYPPDWTVKKPSFVIQSLHGVELCSNVAEIRFSGLEIKDFQNFASLSKTLIFLDLSYNFLNQAPPSSTFSEQFESLEYLDLSSNHLNDQILSNFFLPKCFRSTNITKGDEKEKEKENIEKIDTVVLPNLHFLSLKNNEMKDVAILKFIPNLEELDISFNLIEDISAISSWKFRKSLISLSLSSNPITKLYFSSSSCFHHIFSHPLPAGFKTTSSIIRKKNLTPDSSPISPSTSNSNPIVSTEKPIPMEIEKEKEKEKEEVQETKKEETEIKEVKKEEKERRESKQMDMEMEIEEDEKTTKNKEPETDKEKIKKIEKEIQQIIASSSPSKMEIEKEIEEKEKEEQKLKERLKKLSLPIFSGQRPSTSTSTSNSGASSPILSSLSISPLIHLTKLKRLYGISREWNTSSTLFPVVALEYVDKVPQNSKNNANFQNNSSNRPAETSIPIANTSSASTSQNINNSTGNNKFDLLDNNVLNAVADDPVKVITNSDDSEEEKEKTDLSSPQKMETDN